MTLNRRARQILSVFAQILLFLAILWGYSEWKARDLLPKGTPAPDFSLADLDDRTHVLSEQKGSKVLLYFFSPACRACKFTSENIFSLVGNGRPGLKVYAVALSWRDTTELKKYAADNELGLTVLPAAPEIGEKYLISAYPTIYIVDEEGNIEERILGYTTQMGLRLRLL